MEVYYIIDIFNVICGIITIVAFLFGIYSHFKVNKQKNIEIAAKEKIREIMVSVTKQLQFIYNTSDQLVQISKNSNIKSMIELTRNNRANIKNLYQYISSYTSEEINNNFDIDEQGYGNEIKSTKHKNLEQMIKDEIFKKFIK